MMFCEECRKGLKFEHGGLEQRSHFLYILWLCRVPVSETVRPRFRWLMPVTLTYILSILPLQPFEHNYTLFWRRKYQTSQPLAFAQ